MGPVVPLLALYDALKKDPDLSFSWVGTKEGPERKLIANRHIPFSDLTMAKFDRFFSLRNLFLPFRLLLACLQARKILRQVKPDLILGAGGFVAVPLVWMGRLMGIPSIIHQLDIRPGLANKLMAPFSKKIFLTFEPSLEDYPAEKTVLTGAPVREEIFSPKTNAFGLFVRKRPLIFIFGGGTGAQAINELVWGALDELVARADILHVTGIGKAGGVVASRYLAKEFLTEEMAEAYHRADIVVTRGGIGTLLELAALKKPAVIIPIPGSHQEDNTDMLKKADGALILDQRTLSPQLFAAELLKLVKDEERKRAYSISIAQFYRESALDHMVEEINKMLYGEAS